MLKKIMILPALALCLGACTDRDWDFDHNTELSAFDILSQDINVDLTADDLDPNATHIIEWGSSKAADFTGVFYKVLFSSTGDFDNSDYSMEPALIGTAQVLELSNHDLNVIAEACGVPQSSAGTVKWTVVASNGIADRMASTVHTLSVTRPKGFAHIPDNVVITTSSGEGGVMKKLDNGVFETFVYLGEGDYTIADSESPLYSYGLDGATLVRDASLAAVNPGKIHHITIDFNNAEGNALSVESVGLWYNGAGEVIEDMTPADNHTPAWSSLFLFEPVDGDLKYKFEMKEKDNSGNISTTYYGYSAAVARPQTATSPASYFYLVPEDGFTPGSYCFSLNNSLHKDKMLAITVDFSPELDSYTHTVVVR